MTGVGVASGRDPVTREPRILQTFEVTDSGKSRISLKCEEERIAFGKESL